MKYRKSSTNRTNATLAKKILFFSANGAGCINKLHSVIDNINHTGAGIVTLQETHFQRKGKLNSKLPDFQIFEEKS